MTSAHKFRPIPPDLLREIVRRNYAASTSRWTLLKGGRTNRVWRIDTANGTLVCKLFSEPDDNPLYPNWPAAEYQALRILSRHKIAPEPVALLNTSVGEALIYHHVPGPVWRDNVDCVAALLARLHRLDPEMPLRNLSSGSDALLYQIRNIALTLTPSDRTRFEGFRPQVVPPIERPSIIHTDVVTNNIIVAPDGARLIDWQCPALGDPCEDIASFLSPAMQFLYVGKTLPNDQKTAFLGAYPDRHIVARYHSLAPLFHRRAAAYCFWQAERGRCDYRDAGDLELSALKELCTDDDKTSQNNPKSNITRWSD